MVHLFKLNTDLSIELEKSLNVQPGDDLVFTFNTTDFTVNHISDIHQALMRWLPEYKITSIPDLKEIDK